MFCYNCGNQVADAAVFCDKCGVRLTAAAPGNSAFGSQPYSSGPGYYNSAFTQSTIKKANSKTWYGIAIVLVLAVIVGMVFFLVKCSNPEEEERKIRLSGTYGDSLGLFEFSFRGDSVSITTFGLYIGDAKYSIEDDKMILLDFELLGLGYVSEGETILDFEMDDYSITLEGLRLKKK